MSERNTQSRQLLAEFCGVEGDKNFVDHTQEITQRVQAGAKTARAGGVQRPVNGIRRHKTAQGIEARIPDVRGGQR